MPDNLKISKLPRLTEKRNVVAIKKNGGPIILATDDTEDDNKYDYFISLDQDHPIFDLLTKENTLTLTREELLSRYEIDFINFKTIPT